VRLALQGFGLALAGWSLCGDDVAAGRLVVASDKPLSFFRTYWLVHSKHGRAHQSSIANLCAPPLEVSFARSCQSRFGNPAVELVSSNLIRVLFSIIRIVVSENEGLSGQSAPTHALLRKIGSLFPTTWAINTPVERMPSATVAKVIRNIESLMVFHVLSGRPSPRWRAK
jgi:hypothetical protein